MAQAAWDKIGWREEVEAWIYDILKPEIVGTIEEIQKRPWSYVLKVSTETRTVYFKATAGFASHEVPVTAFLSKVAPKQSPKLLAVNPEKGWMITEDGGQRLREVLIAELDWKHWESLLPQYAKLQAQAAENSDGLLAMGLPNRSLERLPEFYKQFIADAEAFQLDLPDGLSSADYQRLQDLIPVVAEKSQALASFAIPESIHHGDLHDGNIFCKSDNYVVFDWGDSSFSHPFFSMRTAFVSVENRFGLDEGSPELQRVRKPYLAAWRDHESEENLLTAFGLAEELWAISTAEIWKQVIDTVDEAKHDEFKHVMPSLAQEFLSLIKA